MRWSIGSVGQNAERYISPCVMWSIYILYLYSVDVKTWLVLPKYNVCVFMKCPVDNYPLILSNPYLFYSTDEIMSASRYIRVKSRARGDLG